MGRADDKPRLSDVAARAGVSRTTASYIVNGRSEAMRISEDAVARVLLAVEELGYRPNRTARSLRTAQTRTIGLVSDHVASGQFASRMLTGASAAARESDHLLVIGETDGDPRLEQVVVEQLLDQGVDGLVYATLWHREVTVPDGLAHTRTVLLNCVDPRARFPAVVPDEIGGGRRAAEAIAHLPGRVVVLGDPDEAGTRAGRMRLQGLREGLRDQGRGVAEVVACPWDVHPAGETLDRWWDRGGSTQVLVCLNDRLAMGAYQALAARGLAVPDDVGVVAFDGSDLAGWLAPTLSSVGLPFDALGAAAVRMLLDDGRPGHSVAGERRLAMPWMPGESLPQPDGAARRRGRRTRQSRAAARSAVRRNASAKDG